MKLISCVLSMVHSLVRRFFLPLYHYIRRVVAKLLRMGGTTPAGFENLACLLCVCVCVYIYIYICVCVCVCVCVFLTHMESFGQKHARLC